MRIALPWVIVALVVGAWIGSVAFVGDDPAYVETVPGAQTDTGAHADARGVAAELAALRTAVGELQGELRALRASQKSSGPALQATGTASRTVRRFETKERSADFKTRQADARQRKAQESALRERRSATQKQYKTWLEAVRSLKDARARDAALGEMQAAFGGEDDASLLAALQLSRWLGNVEYDRGAFRAGILPHTTSSDGDVRRAALLALAWVQPEDADLGLYARLVKEADRSNAEQVAMALTRTSKGMITGTTEEAALYLLRDGTKIKKAFVIRGLQSGKEWGATIEARMIQIVRGVAGSDYDSAYYFHFITPRLDPKSEEIIDLMLERIGEGQGSIQTIVRGFRVGLSDAQQVRVADSLLGFAENAGTAYTVRQLAEGLASVARRRDIERLEALMAGEDVDKSVAAALKKALAAARRRP